VSDDEQDLREQLRALDPAASLRPADPAGVARLLEDAMSDHHDSEHPETRATGVHERSRLTWLVAAAAVLLIAGVGAFVLIDRGADDVPVADPDGSSDAPTVTTLAAPPGAGAGRCAVPTAAILAQQELAFDGVVEAITDGVVTLTPTMFYAGEPTDVVQVEAPPEALQLLILSVEFEVGQRYLVSANEGQVGVCGFSGPWSPRLEQLFVEAFPG
jgi:hypothetical protein